jgi:signal peptidase II
LKFIKLKYLILLVLTAIVVALDQWTKVLVLQHFRYGETVSMITGYFNLTYIQNTGAAFGMFAKADPAFRVPFFLVVPLVALGSIGYIFRKLPDNDIKLSVALSLVVGGAVGNLIDRMRLGFVVDFLDFHWQSLYHFPAFNVADSAICVGVAILMLDLAFKEEESVNAPASR